MPLHLIGVQIVDADDGELRLPIRNAAVGCATENDADQNEDTLAQAVDSDRSANCTYNVCGVQLTQADQWSQVRHVLRLPDLE